MSISLSCYRKLSFRKAKCFHKDFELNDFRCIYLQQSSNSCAVKLVVLHCQNLKTLVEFCRYPPLALVGTGVRKGRGVPGPFWFRCCGMLCSETFAVEFGVAPPGRGTELCHIKIGSTRGKMRRVARLGRISGLLKNMCFLFLLSLFFSDFEN